MTMIVSLPIRYRLLTAALFTTALGSACFAAETAPVVQAPVPIVTNDAKVEASLREFDHFLDVNPRMQELVQSNMDQLDNKTFLDEHPELKAELERQPNIAPALKAEPNFLIHRTLARSARRPVIRQDMAQLDRFLAAHPDIHSEVKKKPRLLVDPDYMIAHPVLAKFYQENPALSTILLERQEKRDAKKAAGEQK
jgi:hypothetical protein